VNDGPRQVEDEERSVGQQGIASITERLTVVLRPLRHNHHVTRLHVPLLPLDDRLTNPTREDQMLVDGMHLSRSHTSVNTTSYRSLSAQVGETAHLLADIPANRDRHHHQLTTLPRPKHVPKLGILAGYRVDRFEVVHLLGWGGHVGWVWRGEGGEGGGECADEGEGEGWVWTEGEGGWGQNAGTAEGEGHTDVLC